LQVDGVFSLGKQTPARMAALPGIGPAKASRILAACELGRRRERLNESKRLMVHSPEDVARIAFSRLRDADRECFLAILLDCKHRVIHEEIVSKGTLDQTPVHPREVFRPALEHSAAALALAHNHPSGDTRPSAADLQLTAQLQDAAKLLGIRLLDHVIIGDGAFFSLASQGLLKLARPMDREPRFDLARSDIK
jgi:DNA repair protein RadC